ncbi:hypothetical protein RBH88_03190 [Aminobacterium sp. MB27-C1]|uniref:hypothetical protein n=1 Tax=Aminobacterium sp. MB27-C1 TaxID=3070661 RepID=UPI0027DD62D6|nr:hypothetical protein [Aminobacterium sp. MB27-C1]WMI72118.1 hypothetical protein RBH88_03190 [Aminobacterium sp. MB27-C1]
MKILAIRCSNCDFAYAIVEGSKGSPTVIDSEVVGYPKGYDEHVLFHWFHQEIMELINHYSPDGVAVKAAEPMVKRSGILETRIRIEGIALMSGAEAGCSIACRKVKSTIAKDLGMKGKGKYLETKLITSPIAGFDSYNTKRQEAILVGWSCLK